MKVYSVRCTTDDCKSEHAKYYVEANNAEDAADIVEEMLKKDLAGLDTSGVEILDVVRVGCQ